MTEHRVTATHPVDVAALGRLAAPGEHFDADLTDHPNDQALLDAGFLAEIKPQPDKGKKSAASRGKKEE